MGEIHGHGLLIEVPARARLVGGELGAIAESLYASGRQWTVQRCSGGVGNEGPLDVGAVRRELHQLASREVDVALCVIVGKVVEGDSEGNWALALGEQRLPLKEIGAALAPAKARHIAVWLVTAGTALAAPRWLAALGERGARLVLGLEGNSHQALHHIGEALRGLARDPQRGVVTPASLAEYLRPRGAVVALPGGDEDHVALFDPPSLEQLWRLGWTSPRRVMSAVTQADSASSTVQDPLVGAVLPGHFRIDAPIAEGSFGMVYRGRQVTVGREVAIKVMKPGVDPFSEEGRLFLQEVQAVARIDHPHVVRLHQADVTADGRLFFAMELLDGGDLQARVDEGKTPLAEAVALVRQLLSALEAAHQASLVHADVKPANILVVGERPREHVVLVDFGLSRLRPTSAKTDAIGGTPRFMAPEQLADELIDARTDQFAAALVLVALVAGWWRSRAEDLVPPPEVLATIDDAVVRSAVMRALAIVPAERFPSAAAFAAALAGEQAAQLAPPTPPPFHGLAPFTDRDRGRLHGRDRELARLTELAMFRRVVIVTAPSGVGKTSLLRAGLVPRLETLGLDALYLSCRSDGAEALALAPTDADVRWIAVIDQAEAALENGATDLLTAALAMAERADLDASVLVSVREDHLAQLIDRFGDTLAGTPIVRLGPLEPIGAREAIARPLAERRLELSRELMEKLIEDLTTAGAQLGAELGWAAEKPIYPQHLQLACAALYEHLPDGERTIQLAHYAQMGGFDAIVAEHLQRVLNDLSTGAADTARELFLALVTSGGERASVPEKEIAALVPEPKRDKVGVVLEHLRREGLVVLGRRPGGEAVWELVHDSLVMRVHSWIEQGNLPRRRAMELVRHRLRHARAGKLFLLSRAELREVMPQRDALAELEKEWKKSHPKSDAWGPKQLVTRSRQVHLRTALATVALAATVLCGSVAAVYERSQSTAKHREELARRDRNLGLVALELAPFDWNVQRGAARAVSITELPELRWELRAAVLDAMADSEEPGEPFPEGRARLISSESSSGGVRIDTAEVAGGPAFLVISGRARAGERPCPPSIIPIRSLPGYAQRREGPRRYRILIPTCQATRADLVEVPGGPFYFGGVGEPPSPLLATYPEAAVERLEQLPGFAIARTETTNEQFATLSAMAALTGIKHPTYFFSEGLQHADEPARPIAFVDWATSRRFCHYWGRELPSSAQWQKALRGPAQQDGTENRRTFAWKGNWQPGAARIRTSKPGTALPCTHPLDVSVYGACDLVGNVQEWTSTKTPTPNNDAHVVRGASWDAVENSAEGTVIDWMAIENLRPNETKRFDLGFRCVVL